MLELLSAGFIWHPLTDEEQAALERALRVELTEGHPLFGVTVAAIARSAVRR